MTNLSETAATYRLPDGCVDFFVISGSLSHIQKFIYDTTSSGALKNLRGRSFYLSLLSRAVCEALLAGLNLQRNTVLYNSGGTFCVIAPYRQDIEEDFKRIVNHIKQVVAKMLDADMVSICGQKASYEALNSHCAAVFDSLFAKKHQAKHTPYGIDAAHNDLFAVGETHLTQPYNELGSKLCDITAILVSQAPMTIRNAMCIDFHQLGVYYYLGKSEELASVSSPKAYLLLINDEKLPSNCTIPVYREYIAGNGTRAASFEELFYKEDSSHRRLGVLRMDVDNLGALFQTTMKGNNALSAYTQLSHRLDDYFKRQLNTAWQQNYSKTTVIIYAGGDDLFIVGEWESTLAFMRDIQRNFALSFSDLPISLSGGISFIEPKFPIIRAAELSAGEEQRAKSFVYKGKTKNAISFFGTPLRWEEEYQWVENYKNQLVRLLKSESIERSFLQHILRINENVRFICGKITPIRYVWVAAYDLSRMAKKQDNAGAAFIKECVQDIMSGRTLNNRPISSPYHALQLIIIAARLAEMSLWKENK